MPKIQRRRPGPRVQTPPPAPAPRAAAPTVKRASQAEAIAKLLAGPLRTGTGTRICIYGASEKGKTWFARKYVAAALQAGVCEFAIIHDVKFPTKAQYQGHEVFSDEQLCQALEMPGIPAVIVARGECTADACAQAVKVLVDDGHKTLLWLDEAEQAKDNKVAFPASIDWILTRGAGPGASIGGLIQIPQRVPTTLMDLSPRYVLFGVGGRSLDYVLEGRLAPRGASEDDVARRAVGELLIASSDEDWDRTVYGPQ